LLKKLPHIVDKKLYRLEQKQSVLYTKMFNFLKRIFIFVANCRISVGVSPSAAEAPVIIFFPLLPLQLNCGFAGLISCVRQENSAEITADRVLAGLWNRIKNSGLPTLLAGKNTAVNYLDGAAAVCDLSQLVTRLKEESTQECLLFQENRVAALSSVVQEMTRFILEEEKLLEMQGAAINSGDLENINSRLLLLKDSCWMLEKDIIANLQKVVHLAGAPNAAAVPPAAFRKYRKLNLLLNALDRLEVRGRDSAGIQLTFVLSDEKILQEIARRIGESKLADDYEQRLRKRDLVNGSISISASRKVHEGYVTVTFTYKTFSIVGELGRNVSELRNSIRNDRILQFFASETSCFETALTHTRWASVGSISEENCHPVNNYTTSLPYPSEYPCYPGVAARINVVLNGDIDNYPLLRKNLEEERELVAPQVTTDTKIIPLQIEKYLREGKNLGDAFRLAVNDFEGSHAVAMTCDLEPGKMFLALKGSGQSIYVGVDSGQYMFSSELYGLVEVMPRFIKMNGDAVKGGVAGQIFVLDRNCEGLGGISAFFYDGTPVALTAEDLQTAEITTRDIDRSDYPHYFLKEISAAALSIKKTLRGKYRLVKSDQFLRVIFNLGADIVPTAVKRGLQDGLIKNIVVIGHGTAAVAGQAVADAFANYLQGAGLQIMSRVASELSGFGLKDDLSDTIVIPITQSGTTTDTNRAVAMARNRDAWIISIVNRRQSDITAKSQGVFYTSDGRDIEMSVASTKAFYAQIVAGQLLALYFAQILGSCSDEKIAAHLVQFESLPSLMERIFAARDIIAAAVKKTAGRLYWAIVGSGPNKAAADEIRIKLSELCYKTISTDIVENKKHVDLSAEPLILVCASGNPQPVVADILKDVAIFKAHKASVVVFADEGDTRFNAIADAVIALPVAPPPLPVILNTMAGHLWGYFAARAIDEEAQIFREFRSRLATELAGCAQKKLSVFDMIRETSLQRIIHEFYAIFNTHRQSGAFSALAGKASADLLLAMKYAAGKLPLRDIPLDFAGEEGQASPFELLDAKLGAAIEELTRPIDAIRHQAKTVTVGTSRKDREIAGMILELLESLSFSSKNLTYRNILTINRIQPAVAALNGYTVYDISGLDERGNPVADSVIAVRAKGGVAASMKSRADRPTTLMGVKKTIVSTGHVYLGRGKADGAPVMIIPLQGATAPVSNLLLIHVIFNENMDAAGKKDVLGYKYDDIRNLVNEYNLVWNDRYLDELALEALFSESVEEIVGKIKRRRGRN